MARTRILVVEDEQLVADDLRETLEILGYDVAGLAVSGEEAIAKVAITRPHLILMDIRLEGKMDGIEASQIIQTDFQLPVVYLTANADHATLERVKQSEPFGYLMKPFSEKSLTTTIEIALARHKSELEVHQTLKTVQAGKTAAEELAQEKSEYLCLLAHELRNPLTAIKFAAEVLQSQNTHLLPDDKKMRYVQRIQTATNSLNKLLEDVLTLEHSNASTLQWSPLKVDLVDFCKELIEVLQVNCDDHHTLLFSTNVEHYQAFLDEKLLWHLLNNLLGNAVKYSPDGGTVSLSLQCETDRFSLSVSDEGIGIPPQTLAHLFEPFYRAGNVGQIPGTGLGLAIAKQCAELQGGSLSVCSTLGQGTTFTVTLPREKQEK
ncbi:response regulator [Phormidium sp. CLA17]|uniref:hybrid sensor histidine kinase/response regulator n=1 Tax=Leptolyngbya sp. Cla-17 TaxID=2803751 RepID=UPI001491B74C|nr:ATP-binding protein [Leptolyngbya sp. Cla-17]MBM0740780.1 response regulator [Leptolyngbya sp. Cla-17]